MRAMRFAAGVHTSSGLGAGGPIRPATINPTADEPVYVTSLTNYLANYLRKNVFFRGLPAFLLLVLAVTVGSILRSSTEILRRSNVALRDTSLGADSFAEVRTSDDFFAAAKERLNNAYDSRVAGSATGNGGQRSVAVCAFVIRQYRTSSLGARLGLPEVVNPVYVPSGGYFNASRAYGTEAEFWFSYPDRGNLVAETITDPTNSSNVYQPNRLRNTKDVFQAQTLDKSGRVYPAYSDSEFQLGPITFASTTRADALAVIDRAEASGVWIAHTTKALFIDTLWYSPTSGYFFYATNTLEVLGSGAVHTSTRSYPFEPIVLNDAAHPRFYIAVIVCLADVVLFAATVMFLANFYRRAKLEARLCPISVQGLFRRMVHPIMRFWSLYDLVLVALILTVLCVHGYLFYLATITVTPEDTAGLTPDQLAVQAMSNLVRMAASTELGDTLGGWLFITIWLRLFGFLQYIPRLAIVTETVRAAGNDLVGVSLVFLVLVMAFSLVGTVLFSFNVDDFATTSRAFDFLTQLVGTGEIEGIEEFEKHSPLAGFYFLLYGFIVIAVLLNAIIGILANSFVYTVESFNLVRLSDWSPSAILVSVVALVRRLRRGGEESARDEALIRVFGSLDAALSAAAGYVGNRQDDAAGLATGGGSAGAAAARGRRPAAKAESSAAAADSSDAADTSSTDDDADALLDDDDTPPTTTNGAKRWAAASGGGGPSASQSALLQADDENADDLVITLRQLRRLAAPSMRNDDVVAEVFRKAQEQRGTANGKLRYLRIFGRQRLRESDMARDVGSQTVLLAQVQRQLFGGAAKATDGNSDDEEGGDDALLGRGSSAAVAHTSGGLAGDAAALSAAEAARRPMFGFRVTLQDLASQEGSIARRAHFDHQLAEERRRKTESALEEVAGALAAYDRAQTALAVERAMASGPAPLAKATTK